MADLEAVLDEPALTLAARLRAGEVSSAELVAGYLARIGQGNDKLGAFVQVTPRRALRAARTVDQRLVRWRQAGANAPLPALLGVPTGIKDTDPTRFMWNRGGSRAWRLVWSPFDSLQVKRIRRAGMIVLGKLATSEMAVMPIVETDLHPPARNPWNPTHSSGGSSGGSSAAVAGGLLPIAQGADGAGSIRIPAALCHLFGFKCSRGLLPHFYGRLEPFRLSVVGPLAHTVTDAAAMLDALRGPVMWPTAPEALHIACAEPPPKKLRVGVCRTSALAEVEPERLAALERVADWFAQQGHVLEDRPALPGRLDEFLPVFQQMFTRLPVLREASLQPITRWLRTEGRRITAAAARARLEELRSRADGWWRDADLVISPTVAVPTPKVYAWRDLPAEQSFAAAAPLGAFTAAFNATGQPAASVPIGLDEQGLPIGVQIGGRLGDDLLVLRVCRALEEAMPWRHRRAPALR